MRAPALYSSLMTSTPPSANPLYRTKLCAHMLADRPCPAGAACVYAHRDADLRAFPGKRRPRAGICLNFALNGFCVYGANCLYRHWVPAAPECAAPPRAARRLCVFARLTRDCADRAHLI